MVDERFEEQLERVGVTSQGPQLTGQREPGTPVLRVGGNQPRAERSETVPVSPDAA